MSLSLESVYRKMPPALQSAAASARGLYLRSWRYGRETDRLVEESREREQWDERQWKRWREERLAFVLTRAATRVPHYREIWDRKRRAGSRASWEVLENWPILRKNEVRARPLAFLADDRDSRAMFHDRTSGTTGTPLTLFQSRETVRAWYALFEGRVRNWNGVSRRDRWAILGGQLVTPSGRDRPPFWVWNAASRQLYLSSYHLAPQNISFYLDALESYRVRYVLGYASSLDSLARAALETGRKAPRLEVAISNAEPFYERQRRCVSEAFGCPVRDTYGMAEIAFAASECASGSLHVWPEAGLAEVLEDELERPVSPGNVGRLVCTSLLNADMPLVRYETGDRGSLPAEPEPCACGRKLPRLTSVEGRSDDVLITRDGRRVGRLDPVFKATSGIREAQIIQEALSRVRVKVVPAEGFGAAHRSDLIRELRSRLGADMEIRIETVEGIPRTAGGKFRAVVSLLDRESNGRTAAGELP